MEMFILKFRNFLTQLENEENKKEVEITRKFLNDFMQVQIELEEKNF